MLSNLPIAKCRENYIINTNYFSIDALIILVGRGCKKPCQRDVAGLPT